MIAHQLNDLGVIINTIVVDSLDVLPNLVDASIGGRIGDSIIDGELVPLPPPEPTRDQLKQARAEAVANIKVTVNGKEFDGDEVSQTRMARAILALTSANVGTVNWTLADNTQTTATVEELTQALIAAGQRQAELWPI